METIKITRYQSPVGEMLVGSYGDKLCICDWAVKKRRGTIDRRIQRHLNAKYEEGTSDIIERAIGELEEYFAGHRKIFDIPVVFTGSEFQCTVWEELMKIPYGTTISYGELARRIHNPNAVRAVASANATNPKMCIRDRRKFFAEITGCQAAPLGFTVTGSGTVQSNPLALPVRFIQQSHTPKGRSTPVRFPSISIDLHFPIIAGITL